MEEQVIKKILPHSTEAEKSVVGAIMMDPEAIITAMEMVTPDDFYLGQYRAVYEGMIALYTKQMPIDQVTLQTILKEKNVPENFYDDKALTDILLGTPTSINIKVYAKIVKEKARLRELIHLCEGVAEEGYKDPENADEVMEEAEKRIFDLAGNSEQSEITDVSVIASNVMSSIRAASKQTEGVTGLATGFYDLDKSTAGLQKSDLILIAARPSMGKTAFVLNILENVAVKNSIPVAMFSLEMPGEQLVRRLVSMNSKVDSQKLRVGRLNDDEWRDTSDSIVIVGESPIYIDDTPGISIPKLRSRCRRWKAEHGIELIIIDYLQLMSSGIGKKSDSRQNEISDISRALKILAREIDCPVIALSQLNRDLEKREDKRPMLSDLRESGAIEQDADVVMFIYRDEVYHKDNDDNKGIAEIIIGKQRNGPIGTVKLKWLSDYTKFANLERNY